jgi:hypothetical protein
MIAPIATSAPCCTGSGRKRLKNTSGRPTTTSVVPWPRPQRKPMQPALRTRASSEAMSVVTAASWSGSLACLSPKRRLMSRITPTPTCPCISSSCQLSMAPMNRLSLRDPLRAPSARISGRLFLQSEEDLVAPLDALPLDGVQARPGTVPVSSYRHVISSHRLTGGSPTFRL